MSLFRRLLRRNINVGKCFSTAKGEATGGPLIDLRNVVKTYQVEAGTFYALRGINLTVDHGEFVAIVGRSGSGKSTLINIISGIDRPSQGEVKVGSAAIHTLSENELAAWRRCNIGIVFQFFQLLPTLSVLENVVLPMDFAKQHSPKERLDRARSLLEVVGLTNQANKLPASLSGGQQQRAAIARALANDPPLLIADEPTGNLDSATADAIFSLFVERARQGRTIIMVTHDSGLSLLADRAVHVADGQIVDQSKVN